MIDSRLGPRKFQSYLNQDNVHIEAPESLVYSSPLNYYPFQIQLIRSIDKLLDLRINYVRNLEFCPLPERRGCPDAVRNKVTF